VFLFSPNVESMKNYTENIEEQQAHLAASHRFRQLSETSAKADAYVAQDKREHPYTWRQDEAESLS
jgi:hypothetical protein